MRLAIICVISLFIMGASSCDKRPDAFRCVLVTVDGQGKERPVNQWYWFCLNALTNEEKVLPIQKSTKCIRDQDRNCKWIATDTFEEKLIKEHYEKECVQQ